MPKTMTLKIPPTWLNGSQADFTRRVALLDTDLEWASAVKERAKSKRIGMLSSEPCLEGLLLQVLEEMPVPPRSGGCKKKFDDPARAWRCGLPSGASVMAPYNI
jgi:hypothetical protein